MSIMKKIRTGVPGFDALTTGGLPAGRSTLVAGRSGTGKTILGLQAAAHLCRTGTNTIVVGIEESADDLSPPATRSGFNLTGLARSRTAARLRHDAPAGRTDDHQR
jgi:circadian clock protein KaiC